MKDLDFDEIDRAVNSVSAGEPAPVVDNETPVKPADDPAIEPVEPTQLPTPLAGRRGSGHFMDVVHPSSDMRRSSLMMPKRPTDHKPATVDVSTASTETVTESDSEPKGAPMAPTTPKPENNWPDPIDYNESKNEAPKNVDETDAATDEDADIDQISDDITKELTGKMDESSETPFIPGTKVEKRPLGAFSDDAATQPDTQTDKTTDTVDSEKEAKPAGTDAEAPLPDELQDDLLKIESDGDSDNLSNAPTVDNEKPAVADSVLPIPNKPDINNHPAVTTSITQQYKEQPSTGDQNSGAIYDTDAYHKALVRPSRKKSGWMWVVWIVVLIAVGVGVGVVVYNYVLPLL